MNRTDKRRLAIETIDRHGRNALYSAFGDKGVCIPAARMVIEFCKAIDLPARAESVVAVVRNRAAKDLGIWPELAGFPDVHRREYDRKEAIARGATFVIVGIDRPPTCLGDKIPIHVVPVIGDRLIDLNLDCHTHCPEHGLQSLPPIQMQCPGPKQLTVGDLEPDYPCDVSYFLRQGDRRYMSTPFWQEFWIQGGRDAVDLLLTHWRKVRDKKRV